MAHTPAKFDVNWIMDFEGGDEEMSVERLTEGVADGIRTGAIFQLQGMYHRLAAQFIDNGWVDRNGNILAYPEPE